MKNRFSIIKLSFLFIIILMESQQLFAQHSNSVKEVTIAVEQLRKAMISADSVELDKLAAPELSYGHSGGLLQNKQEFIYSFTSGASVFVNIELNNQTVEVVDNTAIVRHLLTAETNDKGKGPGTVKINILLVWIKNEAGEWKLLARQAVKA
jgi:ketosteroid isomerase-like protein